MPHHPYLNGYSVLPGLRRISIDDVFVHDATHFQRCLQDKQAAMLSQTYEVREELCPDHEEIVVQFLLENYPISLTPVQTLSELIPQMEEEVIIHCMNDQTDWMAYGHVCLPSGWFPEEKIGKTFEEIHVPVAGMDLSKSRKLVSTIVEHGPYERFVWSLVFEDKLNFHPALAHQNFDITAPHLWVKVERQVTVGFPKQRMVLFLLSQSLTPEDQIDKPALQQALLGMTAEQLAYKGLTDDVGAIISWLSSDKNQGSTND